MAQGKSPGTAVISKGLQVLMTDVTGLQSSFAGSEPFDLGVGRPRGLLPFAKEYLSACGRRPCDVRVQTIADVYAGNVNTAQYLMTDGAVLPGDA